MNPLQRVFIVSAVRTPIAPKGGAMRDLSLHALGAQSVSALLARCGLQASDIQGMMVGNALGAGGNPARLVALAAGLPESTPAQTIDTQCCSGLDAIALCAYRLASASGPMCWIAGGIESASNAPLRARLQENGVPEFYDEARFSPWPTRNPSMLEAALALEARMGGSRERHYEYAVTSHMLSMNAEHPDRVPTSMDEAGQVLSHDTHSRELTLALCKRAERPQHANPALIAPLADGAAFALMVNESFLAERSLSRGPLAKPDLHSHGMVEVIDSQQIGAAPDQPGLAIHGLMPWLIKALQNAMPFQPAASTEHEAPDEAVHIELMESFTAQVISNREVIQDTFQKIAAAHHLAWEASASDTSFPACPSPARPLINPCGGLLAIGHPIGASGAVLVARLVNQLNPGQLGVALIAAAGGLASGLLLRRTSSAAVMK